MIATNSLMLLFGGLRSRITSFTCGNWFIQKWNLCYVLAAHALETLLKWQGIGVEIWEVSGSFFAIPLTRWFLIRNKNAKIEKRNLARELRARALELPDLSLRRKLLSARDMAQRTVIGQDRIVYSTDRDLFEQDYDTQDWDQRFREIEKSD
ncbi:Uncharacterized protein, chloroplastic [Vitis vinifera]|uniref:Uncharacterized protein, chloroplastic n=1 Tax=Vitis vinifera TaxID=29760 RepID=A0A438EK31_VITVI|nr:Uncharacterized protein, chloroplastic [Vitis vinifera]